MPIDYFITYHIGQSVVRVQLNVIDFLRTLPIDGTRRILSNTIDSNDKHVNNPYALWLKKCRQQADVKQDVDTVKNIDTKVNKFNNIR
jgi:hypothetical protein